jgi:NAD(P)-dependent dehydrogenase (short-subunit alcohol dehydrogenase family)
VAWTSDNMPDQSGKTVLITGANSGLGLQSARSFAASGARVLMACRDTERAARAAAEVTAVAREHKPALMSLDLADLRSIRLCAAQILDSEPVIDVLMLNAGVMAMPLSRTADGFELHFGVNHLGHFALAGRLIDRVLAARAGRVVATSSLAHRIGRMRWDDLNWNRRFYSASLAYGQSKLANLLFVAELDRRFRSFGAPAIAVAAHPGSAHTNLASQAPNPVVARFYDLLRDKTTQPAAEGALPQLRAATAPDVTGGDFWGPAGWLELHGAPARAGKSRAARDEAAARRLWAISEQLTGVTWHPMMSTEKS